jgi:hypothetical protein
MKTFILSFFCSLILLTATAQNPVIQSGDMAPIGFKRTIKQYGLMSPGGRGFGMNWNYSTLGTNPQATYEMEVVSPASTPSGSQYPLANYAHKYTSAGQTSYSYFLENEQGVELIATEVPANPVNYSANTLRDVKFPMNFREVCSDNYESNQGTGTVTIEYDAYGTFSTADTTYTNVVRVAVSEVNVGIVKYTWYNLSPFYPILEINIARNTSLYFGPYEAPTTPVDTTTQNPLDTTSQNPVDTTTQNPVDTTTQNPVDTTTTQNPTGINETESTDVQVYPNPATEQIQIRGIEGMNLVQVYDLSGREVITMIPAQETTLNVRELQTGKYIIVCSMRDGTVRRTTLAKY